MNPATINRYLGNCLRAISLVLICSVALQGCRYWSLYTFSQQFCEPQRYIAVQTVDHQQSLLFSDPVLPKQVFEHYLRANSFSQRFSSQQVLSEFSLINPQAASTSHPTFSVKALYTRHGDDFLLASGYLDPALSEIYSRHFIEQVISSFCASDVDLTLSKLDATLSLPSIPKTMLPTLADYQNNVMSQQINATTFIADFEFVERDLNGVTFSQEKHIALESRFSPEGILEHMHLRYQNYQLWLDFVNASGRLYVKRS
jgi:hypothetical protein